MAGGPGVSTPNRVPFAHRLTETGDPPEVVGGKAAAIARMQALGLPVAPAFAVTVDARRAWARTGALPPEVRDELRRRLRDLGAEPPSGLAVRASPVQGDAVAPHALLGVAPRLDALCAAVEDLWRRGGDLAMAVVVQRMVDGDGPRSGRGVVVSRDPRTGYPCAAGRYVAAIGSARGDGLAALRRTVPAAHEALEEATVLLESTFGDMCEVRFAVDGGRMWLLDARPARRAGGAAVRVGVDLVDEALIGVKDAVRRVPLWALDQAQAPVLASDARLELIVGAAAAAPGAGSGVAVFDLARARERVAAGDTVVLVAAEVDAAEAVAQVEPHAVVTTGPPPAWPHDTVRRPAVCHAEALVVDRERGVARARSGAILRDGDDVTVDGRRGILARGLGRLVPAQPEAHVARLLRWCDDLHAPPVVDAPPPGWSPIRTPEDIPTARSSRMLVELPGADGAPGEALGDLVAAAIAAGAVQLALVLPSTLGGSDPAPPPAPWTLVVAPARLAWAARVLAARLPVVPSPRRRFSRPPAPMAPPRHRR